MVDDDDDDSFGEFTFASNNTPVNPSSQISVTAGDDEWGDFNFFQNNTTDHNLKSPQPQPEPKWAKIQGALPLSLFGEDEKEEDKDEKPVIPFAGDGVKQSSFRGNGGFAPNTNKGNSNSHLGISDMIANLYGQTQQQQTIKAADNGKDGNGLDFTAANSTLSKDPLWKSYSMSSFGLNTVAAAARNHGSDDEGGWEFRDAFSDTKLAHNENDNKERSQETVSPLGSRVGSHGPNDLFATPSNGVFVESQAIDSGSDSKPMAAIQNGFTVDLKADSKGTANELHSNPLGGSVDTDDTFGDFETAFMEQPSKKKELFEEKYPWGSRDASQGPIDLFALPNGIPAGSHKEDNGFDFRQSSVVQNGVALDPFSQIEWKETKDGSDSQPPGGSVDDENFGKFETSFPEAGSKLEGHEASSKNYKDPVPLSIFGIEEDPQDDSSLKLEHELFKSSTHRKNMLSQSSNLSDILSDLYSQAEPISSAYHEHNPDGKVDVLHSTDKEQSSQIVDDDDNFNDDSWDFKDAFSQSRVENQNLSFDKKLNICMDFYSNLKDELFVAARRHLHSLKKAQGIAAVAGEETKVAALDKEIQEAFKELHQEDIISLEGQFEDNSERVISLKQYIETLHEPNFQVLESEYHISRRLSSAESDLRTAIDLINHSTTVLKILTLVPKDEPANYVSVWFKMISVCSQELKHGTRIWKQSLEKSVHSEILSKPQGKEFIIALGEIYRAVVIFGAAVKFYKPWILLSSSDLKGIYDLLEECHSLWSTSGLEEAIPVKSLLESIRHVQNLDARALANEVLSQEESQCRLSLLSPAVVPEMKMVVWNGDKYFVTLANLWANLISPNPPNFSSIHVG